MVTRKLKLLTMATVLTVAALALQGCAADAKDDAAKGEGAGAVDGTGKTLNVLVGANVQYADAAKAWQASMAKKFKKLTGAELKYETYASADDELTKIQTSVVSGQGPDVYSIGTTFTPTAHSTDAFVKLDKETWDSVGGRDRFVPASLGISGPSTKDEVGVPFTSRPFVLAYNKELFAAAGLDKPAESWDGLRDQAKKLTSGDTYGFATGYGDGYSPWKFIWAMANQAGNPLVDGKKVRIDDPTVTKAYETYFGWLAKDKVVNPAAVGWTDPQAAANFATGKSAMLLMTTATSKVTFDASPVKGKYAYATMPIVPPGKKTLPAKGTPVTSIVSGDNLVIAKYSQNQDLAAAYVKLVTSKAEQVNYNKLFGDLPANAAAAKAVAATDPDLEPMIASSSSSQATPFTGAWGDIQLQLTNVTVQARPALANGNLDEDALKAALAKAQKESQASLDRAEAGNK